ncbi:MAG: tyrosine-type recombinase/integrase [Clostridiales bacterium]|nr:tyrosine-type recombinase/integrase [Roseburia sp.]MDD7636919.1 tyrosine-type recombinase/integrase [Clostridiales bacterium]MDY4113466.1 tyrosine-type recombinase/integrase [Roseburia sp.]
MGTTQPIREKESLERFMNYYLTTHPVPRNYALITLGLHTALRISDLLLLRWIDVYDFERNCYRNHLFIHEKKTGKKNIIALNEHARNALDTLKKERQDAAPTDYIFTKNTDYTTPLCRSQAFRIVKRAAEESLHETHISCHSLRKTFGYHAWKQGTPPALLMDIYNHSSYKVTKKYLGIEQDERDSVFMEIDFYKK